MAFCSGWVDSSSHKDDCCICMSHVTSGSIGISCAVCGQRYHTACVQEGWLNKPCCHCRGAVLMHGISPRVIEPPRRSRRPRMANNYGSDLMPLCCAHIGPAPSFVDLPDRAMRHIEASSTFHCYRCNRMISRGDFDHMLGQKANVF